MTAAPALPAVVSIPRAKTLDDSDPPPMLSPPCVQLEDVPGRWVVCQVRSRKEKAFARDVLSLARRAAIEGNPPPAHYFLPMDQLRQRDRRGSYIFHRPIFAGYVFLAAGKDRGDKDGAAGVAADLFATGLLCKAIDVIDQARLVRDLGRLDLALRLNPHADPCPGLKPGKKCRITSGAFQNFEGEVKQMPGSTMMLILEVHMMSDRVVMTIPAADVEPL